MSALAAMPNLRVIGSTPAAVVARGNQRRIAEDLTTIENTNLAGAIAAPAATFLGPHAVKKMATHTVLGTALGGVAYAVDPALELIQENAKLRLGVQEACVNYAPEIREITGKPDGVEITPTDFFIAANSSPAFAKIYDRMAEETGARKWTSLAGVPGALAGGWLSMGIGASIGGAIGTLVPIPFVGTIAGMAVGIAASMAGGYLTSSAHQALLGTEMRDDPRSIINSLNERRAKGERLTALDTFSLSVASDPVTIGAHIQATRGKPFFKLSNEERMDVMQQDFPRLAAMSEQDALRANTNPDFRLESLLRGPTARAQGGFAARAQASQVQQGSPQLS